MLEPHLPAIIWNDRVFSWELLDHYVHSTSRRLKEIGINPASRVTVEAVSSPGVIILFLALWRIGATVCSLDPRVTPLMLKDIMAVTGASFIFTSNETLISAKNVRTYKIDDCICLEPVEHFIAHSIRDNSTCWIHPDAATVIFTSGTSGLPKGVLHSCSAHLANAQGAKSLIPFHPGDQWLLSLPLYRVSGMAVIFRSLIHGGAMVLPGQDLAEAIKHYHPTHISLVPTQLIRLRSKLARADWSSFKAILIGGAPIPETVFSICTELSLPVYLTYGMTETASQIATGPYDEVRRKGAKVLPNRQVLIKNHEICVKGDVLFMGYLQKDVPQSSCVDDEGWFHTGDCGEACDDYLKVNGRLDRMFISGGENIYPETIEKALLGIDGIAAARVEGQLHQEFGRVPVAFIEFIEGRSISEEDIIKFLKEHLLPYQMPKTINIGLGSIKKEKDSYV